MKYASCFCLTYNVRIKLVVCSKSSTLRKQVHQFSQFLRGQYSCVFLIESHLVESFALFYCCLKARNIRTCKCNEGSICISHLLKRFLSSKLHAIKANGLGFVGFCSQKYQKMRRLRFYTTIKSEMVSLPM